jgi:hypothetical protein
MKSNRIAAIPLARLAKEKDDDDCAFHIVKLLKLQIVQLVKFVRLCGCISLVELMRPPSIELSGCAACVLRYEVVGGIGNVCCLRWSESTTMEEGPEYEPIPVLKLQGAPDGTESSVALGSSAVPSQSEDGQDNTVTDDEEASGWTQGENPLSDMSTSGPDGSVNSTQVTSLRSGFDSQATTSAAPDGTTDEPGPALLAEYQQYCRGVRQTGYLPPSYAQWLSWRRDAEGQAQSALLYDSSLSYSDLSDDSD